MVRVAGVDLPRKKRLKAAMTYIYGIGPKLALEVCAAAHIDPEIKTDELSEDDSRKLREAIKDLGILVEGDLRKEVSMNIKRLMEISCYRGMRHRKKLPARGQRTKTNARTKRGRRVTVGSGRRKEQKT